MEPALPTEVTRALDAVVDSLDGLALVVAVCREADRARTAEGLAAEVGVRLGVVRRTLARMRANGMLEPAAPGAPARGFRLAAARLPLARSIAELHATRRVELINHIASRSLQRIQAIADSFRLRGERSLAASSPAAEDDRRGAELSASPGQLAWLGRTSG